MALPVTRNFLNTGSMPLDTNTRLFSACLHLGHTSTVSLCAMDHSEGNDGNGAGPKRRHLIYPILSENVRDETNRQRELLAMIIVKADRNAVWPKSFINSWGEIFSSSSLNFWPKANYMFQIVHLTFELIVGYLVSAVRLKHKTEVMWTIWRAMIIVKANENAIWA